MNKQKQYEQEKKKLQGLNMPPSEYQEAIKALATRLGV